MNKTVSIDEMVPIIREQISKGGKVRFTPRGSSMLPLFRSNMDVVTLEKPQFPLKKYSIVFYQRESGGYVLHRLVKVENGSYTMRGDNQFCNEPGITKQQIIAVVSEFTRNGKTYQIKNGVYKLYSVLWTNTRNIRKAYKRLRRIAGKVRRRINERFK